jgi:exosortase/archaeosortase
LIVVRNCTIPPIEDAVGVPTVSSLDLDPNNCAVHSSSVAVSTHMSSGYSVVYVTCTGLDTLHGDAILVVTTEGKPMFIPAHMVTEGDNIRIYNVTYNVLWVKTSNGITMVGIADTTVITSDYASFRNNDTVEVMR